MRRICPSGPPLHARPPTRSDVVVVVGDHHFPARVSRALRRPEVPVWQVRESAAGVSDQRLRRDCLSSLSARRLALAFSTVSFRRANYDSFANTNTAAAEPTTYVQLLH